MKPRWVPALIHRSALRTVGAPEHPAGLDEDDPTIQRGSGWIAQAAMELGVVGAAWAAVVFLVKRITRRP
jgi:hypothetical protein